MWKKIASAVRCHKPVGIFGCTQLGKEIYEIIKSFSDEADIFFIDNSEEKQKKWLLRRKCLWNK